MTNKVAVVTDSTAYIPDDMLAGLPISVVPLQLIWDHEVFRDGVDIQPDEFYERLPKCKVMPTTSQPTPAAFRDLYTDLFNKGYDILSIHISSALSGTVDSAIQARNMLSGPNIVVMDSLTTGMALGFQALIAARAASEGRSLQECTLLAEQARDRSGVLMMVSTLEFLHRGGRIGGGAAFLGTALNLKPILELRGGKIEAVERSRTNGKALDRLADLFVDRVGDRRPIRVAILHASSPLEAEGMRERLHARFGEADIVEEVLGVVSPVIGTHTGPGTIGLAFIAGM